MRLVNVKVPDSMFSRAVALVDVVPKQQTRSGPRLASPSHVLRQAIEIGLRQLEKGLGEEGQTDGVV